MKLSDRLLRAKEPHKSLALFIADLHEQCELFVASARLGPICTSTIKFVQTSLVCAATVIAIDIDRIERGK